MEHGDNIDALYMNLAKAFDTVPRQRLLVKLKGYGIGETLQLCCVGLKHSGRRQRVVMNGTPGEQIDVDQRYNLSGIAQGNVLGRFFVCVSSITCQM